MVWSAYEPVVPITLLHVYDSQKDSGVPTFVSGSGIRTDVAVWDSSAHGDDVCGIYSDDDYGCYLLSLYE